MSDVCPECAAPFASAADLIAHIRSAHRVDGANGADAPRAAPGSPVLRCALCGARFSQPESLAVHNGEPHRAARPRSRPFGAPG
jgi:uncharacterized C2H2 Zn-finger protein